MFVDVPSSSCLPKKKENMFLYWPTTHIMTDYIDTMVSFPYIMLDEITPGATVRFTNISGIQHLSIRDFIMHVCDKDQHDAAQIWRRMPVDTLRELEKHLSNFQFPGRGQSMQPVITFAGAVKLMMFLPGEKAKRNRSLMAKILSGYFCGDIALIKEIEANAMLNTPVTQMAKEAVLEMDGTIPVAIRQSVEDPEVTRMKRKREELDIMRMETEFKKERAKVVTSILNAYHDIRTDKGLDEITKTVFQNEMLNALQSQFPRQ